MAASDSIPVPRKNTAYRARYPLYLTTGAIATGLTITATVSKDDGAFAAATNAPVEVGASGVYYHDLTSTEMNADGVTVRLTGTGMNPATVTIEPEEAGDYRAAVTSLGADVITAAATAADFATEIQSGLATASALSTLAGYVDTEVAAIKAVTDALPDAGALTGIIASLSAISGYIDTEVAAIKAKTDNLPSDPADASDIAAAFGVVNSSLATIAAYIDTEVAAIKAVTDALPNAGALTTIQADLDDIQSRIPAALVGGRIDASVGAMAANVMTAAAAAADLTTELQSGLATAAAVAALNNISAADVWAAATRTLTANTNLNDPTAAAIATAVLTTAMTESYSADGAAPTLAQAMFLAMQMLTHMTIVGTTLTVYQLDGTTPAATFTLDSATSPTSITRAS